MTIAANARITPAHLADAMKEAYTLLDGLDNTLTYHNKGHTTDFVVPAAMLIAHEEGLSEEEQLLSGIYAAWHDTGFLWHYDANEPIGAAQFRKYVQNSPLPFTDTQLERGFEGIINTDMKNPPPHLLAAVLRDADQAAIGYPGYFRITENLRREWILHPDTPLYKFAADESKWVPFELNYFTKFHNWFTDAARRLYQEQKLSNIAEFKKNFNVE